MKDCDATADAEEMPPVQLAYRLGTHIEAEPGCDVDANSLTIDFTKSYVDAGCQLCKGDLGGVVLPFGMNKVSIRLDRLMVEGQDAEKEVKIDVREVGVFDPERNLDAVFVGQQHREEEEAAVVEELWEPAVWNVSDSDGYNDDWEKIGRIELDGIGIIGVEYKVEVAVKGTVQLCSSRSGCLQCSGGTVQWMGSLKGVVRVFVRCRFKEKGPEYLRGRTTLKKVVEIWFAQNGVARTGGGEGRKNKRALKGRTAGPKTAVVVPEEVRARPTVARQRG